MTTEGIPQVHYFGTEGLHNCLIIDLLGPNLEDLFDMCGRKFSLKTVCMLALQMVRTLARYQTLFNLTITRRLPDYKLCTIGV